MFKNIRRKTLKETDDYKARLEEINVEGKSILFIHIELKTTVTVALIKELRKEWKEYKRKVKSAGYKEIYSYSATPKFYNMFKPFEDLGPMGKGWGEQRVLKWVLN